MEGVYRKHMNEFLKSVFAIWNYFNSYLFLFMLGDHLNMENSREDIFSDSSSAVTDLPTVPGENNVAATHVWIDYCKWKIVGKAGAGTRVLI